jgi:hypothetical protein
LIALGLFAPNLIWQARNDWATFEFLREISRGMLADIPRALYVGGQVVYMNPLALPVWLGGLWFLFSEAGRPYRLFGWLFLTVFSVQLALQSKPYYLAAAFPPLFVGGGILVERASTARPWLGRVAAVQAGLGVLVGSVLSLPILSLEATDRLLSRTIGWAVPPIALTQDLHDEYGWVEQAQVVARVQQQALGAEAGARPMVLTRNYGQASAIQFFGPRLGLPPAASGHMNYHLWGMPVAHPTSVIAYGLPLETLRRLFEDVRVVGHIDHELAAPHERHLPVYLCRAPRRPLGESWALLKRYGHSAAPGPPQP